MHRFLNGLAYLAVLLAVFYSFADRFLGQAPLPERRPAPERGPVLPGPAAPGDGGAPLPPPSARDPAAIVEAGEVGPATGTAFAISGDGVWLTARHVIDGCSRVYLLTKPRAGLPAERVEVHPNADVAVLHARLSRPPLRLSAATPRRQQAGFALGFPQGQPGDFQGALLGRGRLQTVGRYSMTEPILAWAEVRRVPGHLPSLGGLSGGPMFDRNGDVIGVLVAESRRRGRVMTAAPKSIGELLQRARIRPPVQAAPAGPVDEASFVNVGNRLRGELRIAKVFCQAPGGRRRG